MDELLHAVEHLQELLKEAEEEKNAAAEVSRRAVEEREGGRTVGEPGGGATTGGLRLHWPNTSFPPTTLTPHKQQATLKPYTYSV